MRPIPSPNGTNTEQLFLPEAFNLERRIAVHESAHSVADLVLGAGVLEVWVVGDGGSGERR